MEYLAHGYSITDGFLSQDQLSIITADLESACGESPLGNIRHAEKKFSSIEQLANSSLLRDHAKRYLGETPKLVRAMLFNKAEKNNWLVAWHQDKLSQYQKNLVIKHGGLGV